MLSIQCFRCHASLENDRQLQDHLRTDPPCPIRAEQRTEGINAAQEKRLRSRKKTQKIMSEVDKWKDVYVILFPGDDPATMPSPCKFPASRWYPGVRRNSC